MSPSNPSSAKRVLVILTATNKLESGSGRGGGSGHPTHPTPTHPPHHNNSTTDQQDQEISNTDATGFDIKEVAYIHECMKNKQGLDIVYATIHGGSAPIDPRSRKEAEKDEIAGKYLKDRSFLDQFQNLTSIDKINPEEFRWVLLPGCHGALVDFPKSPKLAQVIASIYEDNNGFVGAIGHGVAGLLNVKLRRHGETYLVKNKKIACFTNEEEKKLGFTDKLPYMLEDKLRDLGADVKKTSPFEVNVVVEERLITAQNHMSSKEWMMKISNQAH